MPRYIRDLNRAPLVEVHPDDWVYIDLRTFGSDWYLSLKLPNADLLTYVVQCKYTRWVTKGKVIELHCPTFRESYKVKRDYVLHFGRTTVFDPAFMVLVDATFLESFPQLAPGKTANKRR